MLVGLEQQELRDPFFFSPGAMRTDFFQRQIVTVLVYYELYTSYARSSSVAREGLSQDSPFSFPAARDIIILIVCTMNTMHSLHYV